VAFITAMLMLVSPIKRLADIATPITRGLAALERGLKLLEDVKVEVQGQHEAHVNSKQNANSNEATFCIELDTVSVQYNQDAPPALKQVSLQIASGETVAFVGSSGSGKTTLINLLPRFVLPESGRIAIMGTPIEEWPLAQLRAQFALVSQDVVMLNDTVSANIALGQSIDRDKVQRCLEAANLSDHVARLPNGIDTPLGHNATELSGGQRQRLAIARALYKDAPILILDEATSALDNESERLVQDALQKLMQGRTTLVIAHRLSTIEHADRVVVMERGQMVEQGRHQDLLLAGGAYAKLHHKGDA
jgi:subfamily B ATP-binding cassette protein MsbA